MKALVVVDLQNDFMPGGPLVVNGGFDIIPIVNELMPHFDVVVATQDWHPKNHGGFASMHKGQKPGDRIALNGVDQILWPDHCVQHSKGADFAPGLNAKGFDHVVQKGTDPKVDSYSAFFDNAHKHKTPLEDILRQKGVKEVYFVGVATDYCVKYSVIDALDLGFAAYVIINACRGIGLKPNDISDALLEMKKKGAKVLTSDNVFKPRMK